MAALAAAPAAGPEAGAEAGPDAGPAVPGLSGGAGLGQPGRRRGWPSWTATTTGSAAWPRRRPSWPRPSRELAGRLTALRRAAAQAVRRRGHRRADRPGHAARAADRGGHRRPASSARTARDEVEIRLAAHPGAPSLPLSKGASGGELSRVMLAIEVVFAGADPVPTFVFDEVDAGVGGKAAVEIGRRLARLARLAQVIVVTHLPQVAAFADTHLVVEKSGDGSVTRSGVTRLDDGGPGQRAVPDAGRPGGLGVRPRARGRAARGGRGGAGRGADGRGGPAGPVLTAVSPARGRAAGVPPALALAAVTAGPG